MTRGGWCRPFTKEDTHKHLFFPKRRTKLHVHRRTICQPSATLAYSAPEVITGTAALDGRADVYSLACTLFRLLTGEHPYPTDAGVGATVKAHLDTTPPRVSDRLSWASPQLDSVIAKALAKNPADRYPTAGDFAAAANAAPTLPLPLAPVAPRDDRDEPPPRTELGGAESHGAAADFISLLPHTRAVSQRRQLLAAIAVAGVLIVALSVWLIGRGSDPPDTAPTAAPQTTSTAPPAALEDLRRLLPSGYPADACTPAPSPDSATVITCGPNTDPGGPRSATYTLGLTLDGGHLIAGLLVLLGGCSRVGKPQEVHPGVSRAGRAPGRRYRSPDRARRRRDRRGRTIARPVGRSGQSALGQR